MTQRRLLHHICSITVVLGSSLAPPTAPRAAVMATVTEPTDAIVVDHLPPEIGAIVDWALDLFDQADMELPPLAIEHHGHDTGPCHGHSGIHRPGETRNTIVLCTDQAGPGTEAVVLHELAHAWVDHNVDQQRRDAFQAVRGFDHWRDYTAASWYENGTEQAAEIIAWGLFDRPRAVIRIHQNSCDDLVLGYHTLTGRPPLHGFLDLCPP
jgi:hypothetical protein